MESCDVRCWLCMPSIVLHCHPCQHSLVLFGGDIKQRDTFGPLHGLLGPSSATTSWHRQRGCAQRRCLGIGSFGVHFSHCTSLRAVLLVHPVTSCDCFDSKTWAMSCTVPLFLDLDFAPPHWPHTSRLACATLLHLTANRPTPHPATAEHGF